MGGVPDWAIKRLLRRTFHRRVLALLERAAREARPPVELALSTLPPLRGATETRNGRGFFYWARQAVRSPLVPRPFLAGAIYAYFARHIGALENSPARPER